jgi:predicted ATP-grasp superfamily ATP-dependent carboligase
MPITTIRVTTPDLCYEYETEHIITIHQAIEITKEAIAAITNSIIDLENQISAN